MKKLFYAGFFGVVSYEIAKVYFIMPMPGSQRMESIDLAYFLHTWRWIFRFVFWGLIVIGSLAAFRGKRKWLPMLTLAAALGLSYVTNYQMAADTMFYQPKTLKFETAANSKVPKDRLVIGVVVKGEARAYPIQYIGYHHQVQDMLGGQPVIATYCTVCRTGRVFEPIVDQKRDIFRLVGMDHFNAMFEDERTHSWWRQANGEAIAGPSKGKMLPELFVIQTTLAKWIVMHPNTKIMQPDPEFQEKYDDMVNYEKGKGKSDLTKTDTASWQEKSWVVGVQSGNDSKAFDWNRLQKERVVNEMVGSTPVFIVLASDNEGFFAFERNPGQSFSVRNDTLFQGMSAYDLLGKDLSGSGKNLKRINAYQEFWHSWKTFHPRTGKY